MGGMFGKKAPTPKVPPPPAIPEVGEEVEDYAMRAARRRQGFPSTIITGQLTPVSTGKKTVLG